MEAIRIINLTKKFKDIVAVDNLSLEILEGELFGLLGVNGAGKSTIINILSCLMKPTFGEAFVFNKSVIKDENEVKKMIGISMQETAVAKKLSVKENLEFMADIYGLSKQEKMKRIDEIIKMFSLQKFLKKKSKDLSGGYQRRLSIALALINKPKVLFLDEPTLGLDVIARKELWEIINNIKKDTTIILTTHYMDEVEKLCDRIGIISEGKLKKVGTLRELLEITKTSKLEDAFVSLVTESKI